MLAAESTKVFFRGPRGGEGRGPIDYIIFREVGRRQIGHHRKPPPTRAGGAHKLYLALFSNFRYRVRFLFFFSNVRYLSCGTKGAKKSLLIQSQWERQRINDGLGGKRGLKEKA